MLKKSLLFDLDGTLIDSVADLRHGLNVLFDDLGLPSVSLAQVKSFVGNGAVKLIERAFRAHGLTLSAAECANHVERFIKTYRACHHRGTVLYEGVEETLAHLQGEGYPMALCTNKPHGPTLEILDHFNITHFFDHILGAGPDLTLKPAPDMLLALCNKLETPPTEAVMIGDSRNDIDAGKAAGLTTIAVPYGYSKEPIEDLKADFILTEFSDLPIVLNRL